MASNTVTLEMNGTIELDVLGEELRQWHGLLRALSREVARHEQIRWVVEDLRPGSALATAVGEGPNLEAIERVVKSFSEVGRALQQRRAVPGSWRVRQRAAALLKPLGAGVESIRFETAFEDITILEHPLGNDELRTAMSRAHGSATGRIQTLSSRRRLSFTLYDTVFDRAVNCYLGEGQEDLVRDKWDRRATVEGLISRDPVSGRPVAVRYIQAIHLLPEPRDDAHRDILGLIPQPPGRETAADTIRQVRNGW